MWSNFVKIGTACCMAIAISACDNSSDKPLIKSFRLGSERIEAYEPDLRGKRVGLVVNQTAVNQKGEHLIDFMLSNGINVVKLFSPEHGIRGTAAEGEEVNNEIDGKTGLPIISLYGNDTEGSKRRPRKADLEDVDILVFELQDVGIRFYTYVSTMHYVMESAAKFGKQVMILDRPNPAGDMIDGPIMDKNHYPDNFVGMHPVPLAHGLTIGELAKMISGESWLIDQASKNVVSLADSDLFVVRMEGYHHAMRYELPVPPSPNLRSFLAVRAYPSIGLFESTPMSVGRTTEEAFTVIGHTDIRLQKNHLFKVVVDGKTVQYYGEKVVSNDLMAMRFDVSYFHSWYHRMKDLGFADNEIIDRKTWLAQLTGSDKLYEQITSGVSVAGIHESWVDGVNEYKTMRQKYVLYP